MNWGDEQTRIIVFNMRRHGALTREPQTLIFSASLWIHAFPVWSAYSIYPKDREG